MFTELTEKGGSTLGIYACYDIRHRCYLPFQFYGTALHHMQSLLACVLLVHPHITEGGPIVLLLSGHSLLNVTDWRHDCALTVFPPELQDSERVESGKAAAVAAAGGLTGSLPFFLLAGSSAPSGLQGLLSLGAAIAGCVLFGVTYRYAVRQDANNLQVCAEAGHKHQHQLVLDMILCLHG